MTDAIRASERLPGGDELVSSAVSWAAILAGAFAASAFSLALIALGAGVGLVSVSPWSNNNPSATTLTVLAVLWLIAVQLFIETILVRTARQSGCEAAAGFLMIDAGVAFGKR